MRYMLFCYDDAQSWREAGEGALEAAMDEAVALTHELHAKGQYIMSAPLHDTSTATCVRIRDGKRIVTDGPFAETREYLGGFHFVEVNSLEEAIEIAKKHPGARHGTVEIRPIVELSGLPAK